MKSKVLAITSGEDSHVSMVQQHLNFKMIVFDPSVTPDIQHLTYELVGRRFKILLNKDRISNVDWVWFRKPTYPKDVSVPLEYLELTRDVLEVHSKLVYGILRDCNWVSDPWNVWRANNKLLQVEMATLCSFNIPEMLVTNSVDEVVKFRNRVGDMVLKAISPEVLMVDDKAHLMYTTYIPDDAEIDFSGLFVSPTIFQAAVSKKYDIRVTVVGEEIFACKITQVGDLESEVDWRKGIGSDNLVFEPIKLDAQLIEYSLKLVKLLGLKFGAIDLIVDKDGKVWFLEINPNGQWGFIERKTGLPISKAFASMFMGS